MFIVNNPGNWQDFTKRKDNVGVPIMEVRNRYLKEQLAYDNFVSFVVSQQRIINQSSQGGGPSQEVVSPLPSNYIEFVNNTTIGGGYSGIEVTTSGPTNYTINWGDGTIVTDVADGEVILEHDYAEEGVEYNCILSFDDATLVTAISFFGND